MTGATPPAADAATFAVVLCTAPTDRAEGLADQLLEERLVACVSLIGPVVSRYVWEGRLERANEIILLMKTRRDLVPELTSRLRDWHPYDVPEILEVPLRSGLDAYLAWIDASCRR